jgi:hypothetical protein
VSSSGLVDMNCCKCVQLMASGRELNEVCSGQYYWASTEASVFSSVLVDMNCCVQLRASGHETVEVCPAQG